MNATKWITRFHLVTKARNLIQTNRKIDIVFGAGSAAAELHHCKTECSSID